MAARLECSRAEGSTLKALPDVFESPPPYQRHKEKQDSKNCDRSRCSPHQYEPIRSRANHYGFPCRDANDDGAQKIEGQYDNGAVFEKVFVIFRPFNRDALFACMGTFERLFFCSMGHQGNTE